MTTLDEMREKFGDSETENYLVLARATRAILHVWDAYVRTPDGSFAEAVVASEMENMMADLKEHPDKAVGMVESLVAIIQSMRYGGTLENWFETLGLGMVPGEDHG